MASETTKQKDTMKVEKLSFLVLGLCIVMLAYVLVGNTLLSTMSTGLISPDGRHLAFVGYNVEANVWTLEDFCAA